MSSCLEYQITLNKYKYMYTLQAKKGEYILYLQAIKKCTSNTHIPSKLHFFISTNLL